VVDFVLERDYLDSENLPRALGSAYEVIRALRRKEIDWALRRDEIAFALQVVCDAPNGSPTFAYDSVALAQPDLRRPEIWEKEDRVSRAVRRAYDLTIMAEVGHRCERYRQAFVWTQVALKELEAAAPRGDVQSLLKTVASSKKSRLAGATIAVAGIQMASMRRAAFPPQVKIDRAKELEALFQAVLASGQSYCRSDSFGSQGLFLKAEQIRGMDEPDSADLSTLDDLRSLIQTARDGSKRSLATAPLIDMEYSRAIGAIDGAKVHASLARERLIDFALPRHLDRMTKYRYLSF
jgi:hypothetical protein